MTFDDVPESCAGRVKNRDIAKSGCGVVRFILNEDLCKTTTTRQYLKDDCLFFYITKL